MINYKIKLITIKLMTIKPGCFKNTYRILMKQPEVHVNQNRNTCETTRDTYKTNRSTCETTCDTYKTNRNTCEATRDKANTNRNIYETN